MFDRPRISDYYRQLQESVRGDILRESEEQIMGTDTDELAQYFYERHALSPIMEDPDNEPSVDIQDYLQNIPAHRREGLYRQDGDLQNFSSQRAVVEVPILPHPHLRTLSRLHGETVSMSYSADEFTWGDTMVSLTFETKGYQLNMDAERIGAEVNRAVGRIRETIGWKNTAIEQGNRELIVHIKNQINGQKQKLSENKEKLAALTKTISIPLKKKNIPGAQAVRVAHTPLVERVKPKPNLPEQYELKEAQVNDIVALLDNQARSFEQTPKAFKGMGEENLRDILLSNLNSVFEGGATGETFSKKGKTDIYLKINKGNILIAECKIWGGKALYAETIDQLRSYLTWRHNYGIMIAFVATKDFTKILRESEAAIQAHSSYVNGFKKVNNTHFVSNHHVDDEEKEVKIHHLFYHLY